MKMTLLSAILMLGGTAFAATNSYKVTIGQDSVIEGKTVKAGDYKISLQNGNAVLKQGKQVLEVPAHEVTAQYKVQANELTYRDGTKLQEIRIGGTTVTIVFEGSGSAQSGM